MVTIQYEYTALCNWLQTSSKKHIQLHKLQCNGCIVRRSLSGFYLVANKRVGTIISMSTRLLQKKTKIVPDDPKSIHLALTLNLKSIVGIYGIHFPLRERNKITFNHLANQLILTIDSE